MKMKMKMANLLFCRWVPPDLNISSIVSFKIPNTSRALFWVASSNGTYVSQWNLITDLQKQLKTYMEIFFKYMCVCVWFYVHTYINKILYMLCFNLYLCLDLYY